MSVALRRQRDGKLRPFWYGEYVDSNGKRKVENLGEWKGTPPPSLLGTGDTTTGSAEFEASREAAEKRLEKRAKDHRRKGRVEHLTERLIESKTGRAVDYARIEDLSARWRNWGREMPATEAHLANCDAQFHRFTTFMQKRNPAAAYLYEVTPEDAAAFVAYLHHILAPATAKYGVRLIAKAFLRFMPVGGVNPFAEFVGRRGKGKSEPIHREPFNRDELRALLDVAATDSFMHPLIVTAACTGMRRGDVCGLKWADVDLAGGMVTVKTSKTGKATEIPLFSPLRAVLEGRKRDASGLVFPAAAKMLRDSPKSLTWRFKKIVAASVEGKGGEFETAARVPLAEVQEEGMGAIAANYPAGKKRDRMNENFRRYCAGESVRHIEEETGCPRVTVSADLHAVQDMIRKPFMPPKQSPSMTAAVARVTRVKREHGQKSASTRDWHALRTTFVTLALSAGVPVELVRRVTGHGSVEVVLKHYFRPDREQFRAALTGALPDVLTGKSARMKPAEELGAISAKLAAGTATEDDRARFRKLAAKV